MRGSAASAAVRRFLKCKVKSSGLYQRVFCVAAHSEPKTSNVVAPVAPPRTGPSFQRTMVMQGVLFGVPGAANYP